MAVGHIVCTAVRQTEWDRGDHHSPLSIFILSRSQHNLFCFGPHPRLGYVFFFFSINDITDTLKGASLGIFNSSQLGHDQGPSVFMLIW